MAIIKVASVIISLWVTRFAVDVLGEEKYGVWVTVFAVITWMSISDLGLANGLRNYITTRIAEKATDEEISRILSGSLSLVLFYVVPVVSVISALYLKLNFIKYLSLTSISTISFLGCCLVLAKVYYSDVQSRIKPEKWSKIQLFSTICQFLTVYLLYATGSVDLNVFVTSSTLALSLPYVYVVLLYIKIHGTKSRLCVNERKIIVKEGMGFFVLQIQGFIIYYSLPIILFNIVTIEEVATYGVLNRYFTISYGFFIVMISPLWSSVRLAKHEKSNKEIEIIKKFTKILCLFVFLLCLQVFFARDIIKIWLGATLIDCNNNLLVFSALPVGIMMITSFVSQVYNAISNFRIQILTASIVIVPLFLINFKLIKTEGLEEFMIFYSCILGFSCVCSVVYFFYRKI